MIASKRAEVKPKTAWKFLQLVDGKMVSQYDKLNMLNQGT